MFNFKNVILLISLFVLAISCKKDDANPIIAFENNPMLKGRVIDQSNLPVSNAKLYLLFYSTQRIDKSKIVHDSIPFSIYTKDTSSVNIIITRFTDEPNNLPDIMVSPAKKGLHEFSFDTKNYSNGFYKIGVWCEDTSFGRILLFQNENVWVTPPIRRTDENGYFSIPYSQLGILKTMSPPFTIDSLTIIATKDEYSPAFIQSKIDSTKSFDVNIKITKYTM
jgi:hypothetical protein